MSIISPRGESHLRISDWIYEFINLSIPMQRMCKVEEMGGPYCNKEVLAMLKKLETGKDKPGSALWKGLEKFKDLPAAEPPASKKKEAGAKGGSGEKKIKTD